MNEEKNSAKQLTEPEPLINEKRSENIREWTESIRLMSIVSNIGFTMIGCILTGFFIGLAIEKYIMHKTNAIFVTAGTILGEKSGVVASR